MPVWSLKSADDRRAELRLERPSPAEKPAQAPPAAARHYAIGVPGRAFRLGEIQHDFVHVAPSPRLSRLNRSDNRMPRLVKMFAGMFIFG
jgi:hypothetical protein